MITHPKATIISVYFGKLPDYFEFTKKTIQHNKNFQWIIAGDMFKEQKEENNILFLPYTLGDLSEDCSRVLNTKIVINTPYKICDARPLFPEIFTSYIFSDWVGWADLNCIFGDLNTFLTDNVVNNYDIFTYMAKSIYNSSVLTPYGPFTLLNNKTIKQWYLKIDNLVAKINYHNTESTDLRASSHYLDELAFGEIIEKEKYKVYTRYKPFAEQDIDLPIVFNGRRRFPAKWIGGKIFTDSLQEDYNNRFNGLHSMILHIRSDAHVDIEKEQIIPLVYSQYINSTDFIIVGKKDPFKFIYFFIPTLKYLNAKLLNFKLFFHKEAATPHIIDNMRTFAPEILYEICDEISDQKEITKVLHLNQMPPGIIFDIQNSIVDNIVYDRVYLYKNTLTDEEKDLIKNHNLTPINTRAITIPQLCSIIKNCKYIVSMPIPELTLIFLCSNGTTIIEVLKKDEQGIAFSIIKALKSITTYIISYKVYNLKDVKLTSIQNTYIEYCYCRSYKEEGIDWVPSCPDILYSNNNVLDPRTGICFNLDTREVTPISYTYAINYYNGHKRNWIRGNPNYQKPELRQSFIEERRVSIQQYISNIRINNIVHLSEDATYINLCIGSKYAYGHFLDYFIKLFYLPLDIKNIVFLVSSIDSIIDLEFILKSITNRDDIKLLLIEPSAKSIFRIPNLLELKQHNGICNFSNEEQYEQFINRLKQKVKLKPPLQQKIFLSRVSPLQRHIKNFDEIKKILEEHNIKIIYGNESFVERFNLMQHATHICGYHGALFFDTCFSNSNAKILEYAPKKRPVKCFLRMYKQCKNYFMKFIDTTDDFNCVLDIDEILHFYTL